MVLFTITFTRFNIEATKLTKKGLFSSDPNSFFIVHRASENGVFSPIYQSNVVRSKSNPIYAEFTIKEIELCNGDPNRQLKIEVKKFKDNGRKCDLNEGGSIVNSSLTIVYPRPQRRTRHDRKHTRLYIRRTLEFDPAKVFPTLAHARRDRSVNPTYDCHRASFLLGLSGRRCTPELGGRH